jgi:hypothetical protein
LVLGKIHISQNSHNPNIWLMQFFFYLFHYCDLPYANDLAIYFSSANFLALFAQKIALMKYIAQKEN